MNTYGQMQLVWDLGGRTIRLEAHDEDGGETISLIPLTVPTGLAEEVGRFVLREMGFDPDKYEPANEIKENL